MGMGISVLDYLRQAAGQTIPPFVLELILKSGISYYIKNVFDAPYDPQAELIPIRVWDLRALSSDDSAKLLASINQLNTADPPDIEALHPSLDQGNLWVRLDEVEAIMEWHDRFWPQADEPERRPQLGFHT